MTEPQWDSVVGGDETLDFGVFLFIFVLVTNGRRENIVLVQRAGRFICYFEYFSHRKTYLNKH